MPDKTKHPTVEEQKHKPYIEDDDESASSLLAVTAMPFVVWAVVHSIRTRTLEDFLRYSAYMAIPIAIIVLGILLIKWKDAGYRRPSWQEMIQIPLLLTFVPALYGAFHYALAAAIKDVYLWLQAPSHHGTVAALITIVVTLFFGLVLFYFRLRLRSMYGLSEVLVGLAVAGQRALIVGGTGLADAGYYLAVLTAGVYLVVRGLDNIHQGLTKEPKDPIVVALLTYFNLVERE